MCELGEGLKRKYEDMFSSSFARINNAQVFVVALYDSSPYFVTFTKQTKPKPLKRIKLADPSHLRLSALRVLERSGIMYFSHGKTLYRISANPRKYTDQATDPYESKIAAFDVVEDESLLAVAIDANIYLYEGENKYELAFHLENVSKVKIKEDDCRFLVSFSQVDELIIVWDLFEVYQKSGQQRYHMIKRINSQWQFTNFSIFRNKLIILDAGGKTVTQTIVFEGMSVADKLLMPSDGLFKLVVSGRNGKMAHFNIFSCESRNERAQAIEANRPLNCGNLDDEELTSKKFSSKACNNGPFTTNFGHNRKVIDMCRTLESNVIASASEDGTVRLWDIDDRVQLSCLHFKDPILFIGTYFEGNSPNYELKGFPFKQINPIKSHVNWKYADVSRVSLPNLDLDEVRKMVNVINAI